MLDTHCNADGGSTAGLGAIDVIALGGDGQTVAGTPITSGATLIGWGGLTTIADTIERLQLISQDCVDPINGEDFFFGAASLLGMVSQWDNLPYTTGLRQISIDQNTAAANCIAYYMDLYGGGPVTFGHRHAPKRLVDEQIWGAACVAITWNPQVYAPALAIPNGKWAILGCYVNCLTNYAVLRFSHADFQGKKPGFPVIDRSNTAVANAVLPKNDFFDHQGFQFVRLSEILNTPVCPIFTVGPQGTGLVMEILDIVADTPRIILNLAKVG